MFSREHALAIWILVLGLVGVMAMGADKAIARFRWGRRLSERSLWLVAFAGGFWGVIVGAIIFHHKTSKGEFWPPVVLATISWAVAFVFVARYLGFAV